MSKCECLDTTFYITSIGYSSRRTNRDGLLVPGLLQSGGTLTVQSSGAEAQACMVRGLELRAAGAEFTAVDKRSGTKDV